MDRTKAGLYIHVPFCRSKCPYCDFYSLASKGCTDEYVSALCDEMRTKRRTGEFIPTDEKIAVDTIYFGGGTPSLLSPKQIKMLLTTARECFRVDEKSEITLECNPSSEGLAELLSACVDSGVNRISLGMQSSDNGERKSLGRRGTSQDVENAVSLIRQAGISNISLDVMVGVPGSTEESLKATLDFALSLDVPHISAYMLKIEEGTYYHRNLHKLSLPTEDETADMYLFMSQYLREKGFVHYEISNFCKDGFYSRHNMKYWEGVPYIGLGPSAHSFYNNKRFYFTPDLSAYICGERAVFDGEGGDEEEALMLSLRTYKGISLEKRNEAFMLRIKNYIRHGLGEEKNGRFILTPEGMLVSNAIILGLTECL